MPWRVLRDANVLAKVGETYITPAMTATTAGRPSPTLSPMMSLLLTPPLSPLSTAPSPVGDADGPVVCVRDVVVGGGGTYDLGVPDDPVSDMASFGKGTVANAVTAAFDHTTDDPDTTVALKVLVTTFLDTVCSEAGQLIMPRDMHAVAV